MVGHDHEKIPNMTHRKQLIIDPIGDINIWPVHSIGGADGHTKVIITKIIIKGKLFKYPK